MNNGEVKNNVGNISYQCPSCGANMSYDPVKSALYCTYCETTVNVDQIKSTEEYDLSAGLQEDATWDSGKIIFHCEYCGADNIKDKNDLDGFKKWIAKTKYTPSRIEKEYKKRLKVKNNVDDTANLKN